jgi:hypothetical protein
MQKINEPVEMIPVGDYTAEFMSEPLELDGACRTLLTFTLGPCMNALDADDRIDIVLEHGPEGGPYLPVEPNDVQMRGPTGPTGAPFPVLAGVVATLKQPAIDPHVFQGFYVGNQPELLCRLVRVGSHALGCAVMASGMPIHQEPREN